jgi:hypothetical protein
MRLWCAFGILVMTIICSCDVSVTYNDSGGKPKIKNGITLKSKGVKVEQAFLVKEDGALLPDNNKIQVNEKIRMRIISGGWSENKGKVFIDASEKVETSEGNVFLDQKDLFGSYLEGLTPESVKNITLSVVITQIDKLYDFYRVNFEVKDKNDPERYVEGYYKLYIE